jgi:Mn-dependent DtxR family transcriptional regulator
MLTVVLAVDGLHEEGQRVNVRNVGARMGVPFSTAQGRIQRACDQGYLQYEAHLSNTLRLGPGIVVHRGEVYRMTPIGTKL